MVAATSNVSQLSLAATLVGDARLHLQEVTAVTCGSAFLDCCDGDDWPTLQKSHSAESVNSSFG